MMMETLNLIPATKFSCFMGLLNCIKTVVNVNITKYKSAYEKCVLFVGEIPT